MMNVSNNTLFLNYSDNSISASTSNQRRWYGTDGTIIYYYNYPTTRYIHNTGSTVTVDNSSNNAFIPYSVTTTSGGCRLTVGGETKFACVDGPDFDGHLVDFDEAMARGRMFRPEEAAAREKHICRLTGEAR